MSQLSRSRALIAAILLATAFAVFALQERSAALAAVGRPAPAFALQDQNGHTWRLGALGGRVVFVNFWTSWCVVCQQEAPALETFYRRYGGRVALLGIDWREPEAAILQYLNQFGITYPNLRDADGAVAQSYRLTGVPESWFIAPDGVARVHWVGEMTFEQMQAAYETTTGHSIDAGGVGPVAAGDRALALAVGRGGQTLWIGTRRGLWQSRDSGRSWSPVAGLPRGAGVSALARGGGGALYAAGPQLGLWRRGVGASTWQNMSASLPARGVSAAAAAAGMLYVWIADDGLYASAHGAPWVQIAPQQSIAATPVALLALPGGPGTLLATTAKGVFRSSDGGKSWMLTQVDQQAEETTELASPIALPSSTVPLIGQGMAAGSAGVLFAGPTGVWRSADGGRTGADLPGSPARAFAAVAEDAGQLWALAPNGDLYTATGPAGPWRRLPFGTAITGKAP